MHARYAQGGGRVDGEDAGVGVRGAQQLHVKHARDVDVEGVAGGARDDLRSGGGRKVAAHGLAGRGASA